MRQPTSGRTLLLGLLTAGALLSPVALVAQRKGSAAQPPARPRMVASRDTNSASDYYYYGISRLTADPREAAAAFYWASRINPLWADPLYARRVAMYVTQMGGFRSFALASRKRTSADQAMDSLFYEALLRDPFFYRGLDRTVFTALVAEAERQTGRMMLVRGRDINDPEYSAWMAYTEGDFRDALAWNAIALKRLPREADRLHAERARLHYHLAQHDSAIADLDRSLAAMRKREAKKIVVLYESKAMQEYAVARIHTGAGRLSEAREAFGRALTEDLSFHMAHAGLGDVAFAQHDTATALAEYALAVELQPGDAALRYRHGELLADAGRLEQAAAAFAAASFAEPSFAAPRLYLARLYDSVGQRAEAADYYREFLSLAAARDPEVPGARARLQALGTVAATVAP